MLFIDTDPVICASNTPISLYAGILEALQNAFREANKPGQYLKYVEVTKPSSLNYLFLQDIAYSKRNRDWLINYFNTMSMNNNKISELKYDPINSSYLPKRNIGDYFSKPLRIHSPLFDEQYLKLTIENGSTYQNINDILEISRLILMQLKPTEDEFLFGEPAWLHNSEYRDFVAFDPVQKMYFKIIRMPDKYRYFTSYISNNWKEIECVPNEIDKLIDCILVNMV